jgi:hypothetical protein
MTIPRAIGVLTNKSWAACSISKMALAGDGFRYESLKATRFVGAARTTRAGAGRVISKTVTAHDRFV